MENAEHNFAALIEERLKALGTNVFAFERANDLPVDSLRNVLRSPGRKGGTTLNRAAELCRLLGLKLTIAPADEGVAAPTADDQEFAKVPLHEALLTAGAGTEGQGDDIVDHLAFRRAWLKRIGVPVTSAVVARVIGDSMAPSINDGDLVLIDRSKADIRVRRRVAQDQRKPAIYAVLDAGHARVKRVERPSEDLILLRSDNPVYDTEVFSGPDIGKLDVIGKVILWGHTVRE